MLRTPRLAGTVRIVAERLAERPARQTRGPRYPWALWLDGDTWKLRRRKDFAVTPRSFARAAYAAGRRHGVTVHVNSPDRDTAVLWTDDGHG